MLALSDVFPAPAGINRRRSYFPLRRASVPRASGDKPLGGFMKRRLLVCSPRQWG
ncbi:hypothetical protein AC96_3048 [Escherichia coli 2-156-04_S4_C2]|nr:hypothetical protein AC96_3048 [Escherichia coli 2-156-04_S4_C2]